jgi:hypothetical protein
MSTRDFATEIAPDAQGSDSPGPDSLSDASQMVPARRASGGKSRSLKGLLFGFAGTVTIGLALASWYVGVRIVAANEIAPFGTPAPSRAPGPSPVAAPPADLYLQVAGLGPKRDEGL